MEPDICTTVRFEISQLSNSKVCSHHSLTSLTRKVARNRLYLARKIAAMPRLEVENSKSDFPKTSVYKTGNVDTSVSLNIADRSR